MFGHIAALPDQCEAGWKLMQSVDLPASFAQVDRIVVSAMGGSAIAGSLLASLIAAECRVPLLVVSDYALPAYAARAVVARRERVVFRRDGRDAVRF